jgi:hypothetical protein
VIRGTTTISAHLRDSFTPVKPLMIHNPYLDETSLYLEFFGFGAVTSKKLRTVAALT